MPVYTMVYLCQWNFSNATTLSLRPFFIALFTTGPAGNLLLSGRGCSIQRLLECRRRCSLFLQSLIIYLLGDLVDWFSGEVFGRVLSHGHHQYSMLQTNLRPGHLFILLLSHNIVPVLQFT